MIGKKVFICRNEKDNKKFGEQLLSKGFNPIELPLLHFTTISDLTEIRSYLNQLEKIDWIVFTSAQTVEHFFKIAEEYGVKFYFYPDLKIATVGEKTKLKLELLGYRTNFVPIEYTAEVLAENMDEDIAGKTVLIPCSNLADSEYLDVFTKRGATPKPVVIYENQAIQYKSSEINSVLNQKLDYLTFTSGSAFKAFLLNLNMNGAKITNEKIVCIGPSTAKVVEASGYTVSAIAEPHTVEGIISAIEKIEENV